MFSLYGYTYDCASLGIIHSYGLHRYKSTLIYLAIDRRDLIDLYFSFTKRNSSKDSDCFGLKISYQNGLNPARVTF